MKPLEKLLNDLNEIAYPVAPNQVKPMGLVMFMDGDDIVEMIHHPVHEVPFTEVGWELDPGSMIDKMPANVTHVIVELPGGCWESFFSIDEGANVSINPPGVPGREMAWHRCQRT